MWFFFALLSAFLFSMLWVLARMSRGMPSAVVTSLELSFGPFLLIYVTRSIDFPWEETWWHWYLLLPVVILPLTLWGLTYAVQRNHVTVIKPLSAMSGISALFVSIFFFGQQLSWLGVAGIFIITFGLFSLYHGRWSVWKGNGPWIALGGSLILGANATIVTVVLSRFPHIFAISALMMTMGFVMNTVVAGSAWLKVQWSPRHVIIILCLIVAMVGQDIITLYAFTLAPASYVIAVKRTSVLITAVIGYTFLKEREQSLRRILFASSFVVVGVVALTLG